jgi:hypothetical protein
MALLLLLPLLFGAMAAGKPAAGAGSRCPPQEPVGCLPCSLNVTNAASRPTLYLTELADGSGASSAHMINGMMYAATFGWRFGGMVGRGADAHVSHETPVTALHKLLFNSPLFTPLAELTARFPPDQILFITSLVELLAVDTPARAARVRVVVLGFPDLRNRPAPVFRPQPLHVKRLLALAPSPDPACQTVHQRTVACLFSPALKHALHASAHCSTLSSLIAPCRFADLTAFLSFFFFSMQRLCSRG